MKRTATFRKSISVLLSVVMLLSAWVFVAPTASAADHTINSRDSFISFLQKASNGNLRGVTVDLTADIDVSGINLISYWTNSGSWFQGTFNGNGHTISNLSSSAGSTGRVGLFRYAYNSTFKDLNLVNVQISSTSDEIGALIGWSQGTCTIENVHIRSGSVSGNSKVGGLIGSQTDYNDYKALVVTNCSNAASVSGYFSGGLVGFAQSKVNATLTNCYNVGTVTANSGGTSGGLFGYACGASNSSDDWVWFKQCWNGGSVSGGNYMGGIIGYVLDSDNSEFDQCFNWGNVSSGYMAGGIFSGIGNNAVDTAYGKDGYINNSLYNAGTISAGSGYAYDIGWTAASRSNCFNCGTLSSSNNRANAGYQWSASQMQNGAATISSAYLVTNTWGVKIGSTTYQYPVFSWYRNLFTFESKFVDSDSGTNQTITKTYNNSFTAPNPSKTGYHQNGKWYSGSNQLTPGGSYTAGVTSPMNSYVVTEGVSGPLSSVTYDLNWTINNYAVTTNFNTTGYTVTTPAASNVDHGSSVSFAITLSTGYTNSAAPTCTATNAGTVTTAKSGNVITYTVPNVTGATTVTLGAATLNNYSVTFNPGGTGYTVTTAPASNVDHGSSVSFAITLSTGYTGSDTPDCTATNAGTVTTNKSGSLITYTVPNITGATTITLDGADINTSDLKIDPKGGQWNGTSELSVFNRDYGEVFSVSDPTPPTGYHFTGWTLKSSDDEAAPNGSFENGAYTFGPENYAVDILEANYEINTYTVTFKDWDGTVLGEPQNVTHGQDATPPADPTKGPDAENHYTFDGWNAADYTNITATKTITATYTSEAHYGGAATCVTGKLCAKAGCGYEYTAADPVSGHAWTDVTYNWVLVGDNWECTATRSCGISGCPTPTETETVTATGQKTKDPGCTTKGETTYTAVFENAAFGTETKTVDDIDSLGHEWDYENATYVWNDYASCTAKVPCSRCSYVFPDVTSSSVTCTPDVTATCLVEGSEIYTAVFSGRPLLSASKTKNLGLADHVYGELTPAVAHDCENDGTIAYYECSVCHQKFNSEKVAVESIVDASTGHTYGELIPAVAPSCEGDGSIAYYECSVCHQKFDSEKNKVGSIVDPATGHVYGELIAAVAPSCEGDGSIAYYECAVCHQKFDSEKNKVDSIVDPATGHVYGELIPAVAPSCEGDGSIAYYECAVCHQKFDSEKNKVDSIVDPATGHTYGELIAAVAPSCEEDGTIAYYECSTCHQKFDSEKNKVDSIVDPATGHTYGELIPAVAPSCEGDGTIAYYECATCHQKFNSDKNKVDSIVDPATGHAYGELIPTVAPSCEGDGTIAYYECSVCHQKFDSEKNKVDSIVDPATGHTYGELIPAVAPSCEGDGTIAYYECSTCHQKFDSEKNKVESIVDPATGHVYGELIAAVVPSCEGDGTIAYYECATCHQKFDSEKNKVDSVVDPATGHKFTVLQYDENNHWYKCEACDATSGTEAHTGTATCVAKAVCTVCAQEFGTVDLTNHATDATVTRNAKDPGYTFKGYTGDKFCAACDELVEAGQDIDKLSVDGVAAYIEANNILADSASYNADDIALLNDKLNALTAALAGENNDAPVLAALEELAQTVAAVKPAGPFIVTFQANGATVKVETVEAGANASAPAVTALINTGLKHKRFTGWSEDFTNVMSDLTVTALYEEEAHTWTPGTVIKEATCMATGLRNRSCVCGAGSVETLDIDSENHAGSTVTTQENLVPATCSAQGSYTEVVTCECGTELSRTEKTIATLPHTPGEPTRENQTEATCTQWASYVEVVKCTVCGQEASRRTVYDGEPLGHAWSEWTVTKEPTCTQSGIKTRTCTRDASHSETVAIDPVDHVDSNGDNACDVCGATIDTGFRCSWCGINDRLKDNLFIGWFISIVHDLVHMVESGKSFLP